MHGWTWVAVVVVAAAGCGKDTCEPKRKVAADHVVSSLHGVEIDRDKAQLEITKAKGELVSLDMGEEHLVTYLKLFEQSMDCLVRKDDCCKRLSKLGNGTQVWSTMSKVFEALPNKSNPYEVDVVLAPMKPLETEAEDLITASPKQAEKFCTDARAHIARIRTEAPAAWNAARAKVKADIAERKKEVEMAQQRIKAIGAWADAIRKNQKATIDASLTSDGDSFSEARDTVAAYNAACH